VLLEQLDCGGRALLFVVAQLAPPRLELICVLDAPHSRSISDVFQKSRLLFPAFIGGNPPQLHSGQADSAGRSASQHAHQKQWRWWHCRGLCGGWRGAAGTVRYDSQAGVLGSIPSVGFNRYRQRSPFLGGFFSFVFRRSLPLTDRPAVIAGEAGRRPACRESARYGRPCSYLADSHCPAGRPRRLPPPRRPRRAGAAAGVHSVTRARSTATPRGAIAC